MTAVLYSLVSLWATMPLSMYRRSRATAAPTLVLLVSLVSTLCVCGPVAAWSQQPSEATGGFLYPASTASGQRPAAAEPPAAAMFPGTDAVQQSAPGDGATAEAGRIVVRQIGDHTLYIPEGYISAFLGYSGYAQIHALLPCFLPETPENSAQFHTNTWGNILTATLSAWRPNELTGAQLLGVYVAQSLDAKVNIPFKKKRTLFVGRIGKTRLFLLKDLLSDQDIFVLAGSIPLFIFACDEPRPTSSLKFYPSCFARENIWGNDAAGTGGALLEYRYSRSFVDSSLENGLTFDERLRKLLNSFRMPKTADSWVEQGGACK